MPLGSTKPPTVVHLKRGIERFPFATKNKILHTSSAMRLARLILFVSVILNGILCMLLFWPSAPAELTTGVSPKKRFQIVSSTNASTNPAIPKILVRKQFFSWNELESSDYVKYVANLRDIECPESTICDLILADINQLYFQKWKQIPPPAESQRWWKEIPDPLVVQSIISKQKALEEERRALLTQLLGASWETNFNADLKMKRSSVIFDGPVLSALNAEIREQVSSLVKKYPEFFVPINSIRRQDQEFTSTDGTPASQQSIRGDLARYLNPEQLEEFLLRYSHTAAAIRSRLEQFDPSPDEFRQLFRLQSNFEMQLESDGIDSSQSASKKLAQLEKQNGELIAKALGADRAKQYYLSQDPSFLSAKTIAQNLGASDAKIIPIYEINRLAKTEETRIQNDSTLSFDEREKALLQIRLDLNKSIRAVVGLPLEENKQQNRTQTEFPPLPE